MFRFGISEYIRNWWFNLCVILIMVVMMLISTIFISNIDEQTKIHRLASKYIDTDSIFVANVFDDFYKEISMEKNMLISQTFLGIKEIILVQYVLLYIQKRLWKVLNQD